MGIGRSQHGRLSLDGRSIARREAGRRPATGSGSLAILLDPSAVVAAADAADLNHRAAVAWFARADEPLLLGALGLGELDLLLQRELGVAADAGRRSRRSSRTRSGSSRRRTRTSPAPRC